jgi:sugar (pentulose or hexulose) kinase
LTGARFPRWSAAERGTIAGLSLSHGCLHLVRAALEGAAFAVADALDALRARVAVEEIIMVGGLAASPLALQLRADVLDVPIVALADREASLAGAAMLAGVAAGIFADAPSAAATFVRRAGMVLPNPGARTVYRERRAAWGRLAAIASGAGAV